MEQIQERVGAVMAQHETYQDFGTFFHALLQANDNMSSPGLAENLTEASPHKYGRTAIESYRKSYHPPSYRFVKDVLDTNALHFKEVTPELRKLFFDKAHLTEVTAASADESNRKIMRRVETDLTLGKTLQWVDIMKELLAFHMQGDRMTVADIQKEAKTHVPQNVEGYILPRRLTNVLQKDTRATETERRALYRFLRLESPAIHLIETEVQDEKGKIKDTLIEIEETDFSRTLDAVLTRLKSAAEIRHGPLDDGLLQKAPVKQQMDARQLEARSRQQAALKGQVFVTASDLSDWRKGQKTPILNKVRALVRLFQSLVTHGSIVQQADVDNLTRFSPFSEADLHHTAHQMIGESDEQKTDIHALLKDIRGADGIDISMEGVVATIPPGSQVNLTLGQIKEFEKSARDSFPLPDPLRELMRRYDYILQKNGHPALDPDDIDKVLRIAEQNRTAFQALPHEDKKARKTSGGWGTRVRATEAAKVAEAAEIRDEHNPAEPVKPLGGRV